MKIFANLGCIVLVLCFLLGGCRPHYEKYQSEYMGLFDTVTVIVGYTRSEDEFNLYAEAIYQRMAELNRLFDIYNAYEGVNNLHTINKNAGIAPVEVEREIIDLLLLARTGYELTNGVVNVTMGSVFEIWHDYRDAGISNADMAVLPPMNMLREAANLASMDNLIIDDENNTVFLKIPGMRLDVGAVAKGYAAGLAAKAARDIGAHSMLLNMGGNIIAIGQPMDNVRARWGIGIQDPEPKAGNQGVADIVYLNDGTVSCSGDYQRFYLVNGQRYSHIIDPQTLMPAKLYRQVAVIHGDSGMADLLSTALFILPQKEGAALAQKIGAEALWIYPDGSRQATEGYVKCSKNMGNYSAVD